MKSPGGDGGRKRREGAEEELWGAPAFGVRQGYEGIGL